MRFGWGLIVLIAVVTTPPATASMKSKINSPQSPTPVEVQASGDYSNEFDWREFLVEDRTILYSPQSITEETLIPWVAQVNAAIALADSNRPVTQSVVEWVKDYPELFSTEMAMLRLIDAEVVSPTGAVLGVIGTPNVEWKWIKIPTIDARIATIPLPVSPDIAMQLLRNLKGLIEASQQVGRVRGNGRLEKMDRIQWLPTDDPMPIGSPPSTLIRAGYRPNPSFTDPTLLATMMVPWGPSRSDEIEYGVGGQSVYGHWDLEWRRRGKFTYYVDGVTLGGLDWGVGTDRVWDASSQVDIGYVSIGVSAFGDWGDLHADVGPAIQFAPVSLGYTAGIRYLSPQTEFGWLPIAVASFRRHLGPDWVDGRTLWGLDVVQLSVRWTFGNWAVSIGKEYLGGQGVTVGDGVFGSVGVGW